MLTMSEMEAHVKISTIPVTRIPAISPRNRLRIDQFVVFCGVQVGPKSQRNRPGRNRLATGRLLLCCRHAAGFGVLCVDRRTTEGDESCSG